MKKVKNIPNKFSLEKEKQIVQMYLSGLNQVEIANHFNTFNTSIRRVLLRNDCEIMSTGERIRFVKTNPFKDNCEKSDYFIGLLATDGCISGNTLTLGLKESDISMLQSFANFLSPQVKINKYFHKEHGIYQYQVSCKNNEVNEWLKERVQFINKTKHLEMKIPINWNIMRGIIDGDGSVFFCK